MKNNYFKLIAMATLFSNAINSQTPRKVLYEEFTGENCPPCASTNPGLDALLKFGNNPTKIIPIKWQVPIPSAPSATWSLYQTNKSDINWRYQTIGYGYGINSAPSSKIDGQNATVFGASSNHPANLNNNVINNAAAATSPFSIIISPIWDAGYNSATVSVTLATTANFAPVGTARFRLVLIEREIIFPTSPGTNGEKEFNWVVRSAYPTIQFGTALTAGNWTNGQTQTFTVACPVPSYINDKGQISFVGFIQDDGDKKVWQTEKADLVGLANDAKALGIINIQNHNCSASVTPNAIVYNNGVNAITALTLTPRINLTNLTPVTWSGNLAPAQTATITLNTSTLTNTSYTYSYNITGVSGGDMSNYNNKAVSSFVNTSNYNSTSVNEGFVLGAFPPVNWSRLNSDLGVNTWVRSSSCGAYDLDSDCAKYDFYNNAVVGDVDELYLPPMDLSSTPSPSLTFDYAHAQYSANYFDSLEVYTSTNCGANWTKIFSKGGASLATAPTTTANYVAAAAHWSTVTIPLTGLTNPATTLVKFVALNDNGNNVYVDNINVQGAGVGIKSNLPFANELNLFPNPSNAVSFISLSANYSTNANINIYNTLGQIIYKKSVDVTYGINTITLPTENFGTGFYNVIIESKEGKITKKLNVIK